MFELFFYFLMLVALAGMAWCGKQVWALGKTSGMGSRGATFGYGALAIVCAILALAFGLIGLNT